MKNPALDLKLDENAKYITTETMHYLRRLGWQNLILTRDDNGCYEDLSVPVTQVTITGTVEGEHGATVGLCLTGRHGYVVEIVVGEALAWDCMIHMVPPDGGKQELKLLGLSAAVGPALAYKRTIEKAVRNAHELALRHQSYENILTPRVIDLEAAEGFSRYLTMGLPNPMEPLMPAHGLPGVRYSSPSTEDVLVYNPNDLDLDEPDEGEDREEGETPENVEVAGDAGDYWFTALNRRWVYWFSAKGRTKKKALANLEVVLASVARRVQEKHGMALEEYMEKHFGKGEGES